MTQDQTIPLTIDDLRAIIQHFSGMNSENNKQLYVMGQEAITEAAEAKRALEDLKAKMSVLNLQLSVLLRHAAQIQHGIMDEKTSKIADDLVRLYDARP